MTELNYRKLIIMLHQHKKVAVLAARLALVLALIAGIGVLGDPMEDYQPV